MRAADYIVAYLKRHLQASHVFTYAGGTNAPLLDAMHRGKVTYVPMRHEVNAAFAAEGFARASGRTGIAVAMSGPGATNLVTGIANAYFDSSRVLYVTGQVVSRSYKFDRPIRQLGYQETDIVGIVKPITKYANLVWDSPSLAGELEKAVVRVESGRTGPVLIDITFDILMREMEDEGLEKAPAYEPRPRVSESLVKAVEEEILAAKRPVIIAGGGVRLAGAEELVLKTAERYGIPVAVSLLGKDAFPNDHPLYQGLLGAYGNRQTNLTVNNSDLILVLGSRLDSRQTANPTTFGRQARKIHIDIDKTELNNTVQCDLVVHAHLADFLERLNGRPAVELPKREEWDDYCRRIKGEFTRDWVEVERGVTPITFMETLSQAAADDAIFTTDVGNNQIWAAKALVCRKGQRFLTSGGLGSMGFSIPVAIGAAFAGDRQVIALVGDGGFQMSMPELSTIRSQNLPIKMVVVNNGVLGLMKNFQDENFESTYPATVWGYSCPDLEKVAAAFEIPAFTVEDDAGVEGALEKLLSTDGPALLNVVVDRENKPYPKVRPGSPLECQDPPVAEETWNKYMVVPPIQGPAKK